MTTRTQTFRTYLLAALALSPLAVAAQQTAPVSFDVISVKPHKGDHDGMMWQWTSTGFRTTNNTLKNLIANAYGVKLWLIFGLPPWGESAHWDMEAKVTGADAMRMENLNWDDRRTLLQNVLKERFGLVAHAESKVQPVFDLSVMPGGVRMKPSPPPPPGQAPSKWGRGTMTAYDGKLTGTYMTMPVLAENIAYRVDRTVVDKTGLSGEYDLELKWTPEDRPAGNETGAEGDTPPAIFEALKEQLGLKLTPSKAPVPVVVVDRATQPETD